MGHILIKAARDVDLYLEWSSVADGPLWIGTRAEAVAEATREYRRNHPHCTPMPGYGPEDRVKRADERGTSMLDGDWYGWDDEGWIVEQRGVLPRARLVEFAHAYQADDIAAAYALLEPFEDAPVDGETT